MGSKFGELAHLMGSFTSAIPGFGTTGNTPDGTERLSFVTEKKPGVPTGKGV